VGCVAPGTKTPPPPPQPQPAQPTQPAENSLARLAGRLLHDGPRLPDRTPRSAPPPPPPPIERPPLRALAQTAARPAKQISEHERHAPPQGLDPYGRSVAARDSIKQRIL